MSDFYGDMLELVSPELGIREQLLEIGERRGLPLADLVKEALQDFLAKELLNPKSPMTDYELGHPFPAGEDSTEAFWPWEPSVRHLPLVSSCPDTKLEEWLEAVLHDIQLLNSTLAAFSPEERAEWAARFSMALTAYEKIRTQLLKRIERRDTGKGSHHGWDGYLPGSSDIITAKD